MPRCYSKVIAWGFSFVLAPRSVWAQDVRFQDQAQTFVVTNAYYTATISKQTGELSSVIDVVRGRIAVSGEKLTIRTGRSQPSKRADLSGTSFSIQDGLDFYVRAVWTGTLSANGGSCQIERTYEFTKSPYIYQQVAIFFIPNKSAPRDSSLALDEVSWEFQRQSENVAVGRTTDDLWTELPRAPLGGLELRLVGHTLGTKFDGPTTSPRRRIVISGHLQDARSTPATLGRGRGLIGASVVSLLGRLPDDSLVRQPQFWFYPGYGLRESDGDTTLTFVNWNRYELSNRLIPLRRKYLRDPTANDWFEEDMLIRITMHLVNRMKLDGGWPRWSAWSSAGVTYPQGDIFTAHSRAFPAMAYLWSYLTIDWESGGWLHSRRDADVIYDQLDQLRRFYGVGADSSRVNFKDRHQGVYYIAYSANRKEVLGNGPRGVLNTHAQALEFAWIMKEASELRGSPADARRWEEIIEFYHPGSRMLYALLYPGAKTCHSVSEPGGRLAFKCDSLSGHVGYSIGNPCIYPGCAGPAAHVSYSIISHEGIAVGYLDEQQYEPEFVDVVERASRLDFDPYSRLTAPRPGALIASLCRVLPLALAFTSDSFSMVPPTNRRALPPQRSQYAMAAASLKELMTFARLRFRDSVETQKEHDPQLMIVAQDGDAVPKVIWSNKRFVTDWIPGFWEEKSSTEVPSGLTFSVDVRHSRGGKVGNWTAYRIKNRIEVMSDFDSGLAVLKLPPTGRETRYLMGYRDYDPHTLRWTDPVNDAWGQSEARIKWGEGVQKYRTLAGDFDGDGKTDLAFPFQGEGGLTVRSLLSNGDGTWRQPSEARIRWAEGVQRYPTLTGDFDGDGKTDLAFPFQGEGGLTVRLLLSNGDGTWRQPPEQRIKWGEGVQKYRTLAGDYDGDGKTDLAFPFQGDVGLTVRLLLSNGDGTWRQPPEQHIKWGEGVQKYPTLAGDYDGDGKTDLAFPSQGDVGLTVRLLLSNGDGTWRQPPEQHIKWGEGVQKYPTLAGDYDGDGKTDLAFPFQGETGLTVRLLLSNGDGTWRQPPEAQTNWRNEVQEYPTLTGDVDGDRRVDLIFPFQEGQGEKGLTVRVLLSNGDGTWASLQDRVRWGEGVQAFPTLVGDLNRDGRIDLIFPFQDSRDERGLTVRALLSREASFSVPSGGELVLPNLAKKRLVFVELR